MKHKVYLITNIVDNKQYVGYTSKELQVRFKEHRFAKKHIGHAMTKHGFENFKIELICEFDNIQDALDAEILNIRERNTRQYGYNISKGGDVAPPSRNEEPWKTEDFSNRMKEQANRQHSDIEMKKTHLSGIRKYWENITEEEMAIRIEIAKFNGKKGKGNGNKGIKMRPEDVKWGVEHPSSKEYVIIHPDGTEESIKCLKEYCRNNNFCERNFHYVLSGEQKHHKGFKIYRKECSP